MRNAALGAIAGLFLFGGCSGVNEVEPEIAILVPSTAEDFTDDWHTADWPRAAPRSDESASPPASTSPTRPAPEPGPATTQTTAAVGAGIDTIVTTAQVDENPEVLAFDDTGAEFCEAVLEMRAVLQWSNTTFTENSSGAASDMVTNFQTAVAAAQTRDDELNAAMNLASERAPSIAVDLAIIRDRHVWVMAAFEDIGRTAADGFEINSQGLDLFESSDGVAWAGRLDHATTNVDALYQPACGAGFGDPVG